MSLASALRTRPRLPGRASTMPTTTTHESIADWLQVIRAEYDGVPGLRLTKRQVQRVCGMDAGTCEALLELLVSLRFLRRAHAGTYVRADFT
jgi:hypothetical protein